MTQYPDTTHSLAIATWPRKAVCLLLTGASVLTALYVDRTAAALTHLYAEARADLFVWVVVALRWHWVTWTGVVALVGITAKDIVATRSEPVVANRALLLATTIFVLTESLAHILVWAMYSNIYNFSGVV